MNKCKHYDNKRDILAEMRRTKMRTENAVAATYTAYMMLAALTLYDDLGFRDKRLRDFVNGMYKRIEEYEDGTLTVDGMEKRLLEEVGVYVEPPKIRGV